MMPPTPTTPTRHTAAPPRRSRRRLVTLLAIGLVLGCLALLVIGVARTHWAEEIVRVYAERIASDALESRVTIGAVSIDPFRVGVVLEDVEVTPPTGGRLLKLAEARINLAGFQTLGEVLRGRVHLDAIELRGPEVSLEIVDGKIVNLPPPILRAMAEPKSDEPTKLELPFRIDLLVIHDGVVRTSVPGELLAEVGAIEVRAVGHPDGKGFEARVSCSAGGLDMARLHEPLRDLTLEAVLRLDPLSAKVAVLRLSTPRVALNASGEASLGGGDEGDEIEVDGHATLSFPLELVSEVRPDLPALSGHVSVEATGKGTLPDVKARAILEVFDVKAGELSLDEARVVAALQDNGVKLEEARVKVGSHGYGTVTGFLELGGTFPFRGDAAVENLEVSFIADAAGQHDIPVEVVGSGKATFTGEIRGASGFRLDGEADAIASDIHVAVTAPRAAGPRVISLSDVHGSSKVRITDHLELIGGRATRGSITVTGGGSIWPNRLDLHATANGDAGDAGPIAGMIFGGRGGGEARVWGPFSNVEVRASGAFTGVKLDGRAVGDVTGEMHYLAQVVTASKLRVVRGLGHVDVPKLIYDLRDPRGDRITTDLAVDGMRIEDLGEIAGLQAVLAKIGLGGVVSGWAHVEGPAALPDLQAGLALDEWTLLGERFGPTDVEGTLVAGVLDLTRAEVIKGGGSISARGTLDKAGKLDFQATVSGLKLSDIDNPLVRGLGFAGVLSGAARVGGTTSAPAVAGDATLSLDRGGSLAVVGRVDSAGVGTFDATMRAMALPVHEVLAAALAGGNPERAAALSLPKVAGELDVAGTVRGSLARFGAEGTATVKLDGGGKVTLKGRVDVDPAVQLALDVSADDVSLTLALRTALAAASPTTGDWKNVYDAVGIVSAKGKLSGPATAPSFEGDIGLDLGKGGTATAKGRIDTAGALGLDLKTKGLSVDRAVRLAVSLVETKRAPELLVSIPPLQGTVDLTGRLAGTISAPDFDAHANAYTLGLSGTALGDAELDVTLVDGRALAVTGNALAGAVVSFRTTLEGDLPFDASVKFPATDLLHYATSARAVLPGLAIHAEGEAKASGALTKFEAIVGSAGLTRFDIATTNVTIGAAERLSLTFAKGRLGVKPTTFAAVHRSGAEPTTFLVGGSWDVGGELNLDIDGDVSLGVIAALVPGGVITDAVGTIEGFSANVRGTPESPFMTGRGHVVGKRFGLSFIPEELSDFTGEVALAGSQVELIDVAGSVGSGWVTVSGTIDLETVTNPVFDLTLDIRETTTRFIEDFPAMMDGRLVVHGTPRAMSLQGSFEVLEAHYTADVDWKPNLEDILLKRLSGRTEPRAITVGKKIEKGASSGFLSLDIELRADGGIFVKNNVADLEAYIDSSVKPFRIQGTDRNPYIDGTARVKPGGYLMLFDKEFEITRGDVVFEDKYRIDPRVDVEAVALIDEYNVTVAGHGTVNTLSLELKSDPPKPPDDIALLITLGVSREDFESGGLKGAGVGGFFTATGVTEKVLKPVEDVIPVDFAVGTRLSERTGTYVPVVVGAKRITPKLRLRGSTSFADPTGDFEGGGELKLGKGWSFHGTYEVESATGFGDVGLDVKWKKKF